MFFFLPVDWAYNYKRRKGSGFKSEVVFNFHLMHGMHFDVTTETHKTMNKSKKNTDINRKHD